MKIHKDSRTRIVITGTPGVGKHTCSRILSQDLDLEIVDINQVVVKNKYFVKTDNSNENEINLKKTIKFLKKELESKKRFLVVGHLAPYVIKSTDIDLVVILRRNPYQLREVYKKRDYSFDKIKENIASEVLGIISYDSLKAFGKRKVAEIDTSNNNLKNNVKKIEKIIDKELKNEFGKIDWLPLIYENKDFDILLNR